MPKQLMYFRAGETYRSEDIDVLVNGVPLPMCFEADVEGKWAKTYVEGPDGLVKRDDFDRRIWDTIRGTVEIRLGR